jgi:hypothetical protein
MKNYLIILVLFLSFNTKAQESGSLSLNLYGGYNFSDKVSFDYRLCRCQRRFSMGCWIRIFCSKIQFC